MADGPVGDRGDDRDEDLGSDDAASGRPVRDEAPARRRRRRAAAWRAMVQRGQARSDRRSADGVAATALDHRAGPARSARRSAPADAGDPAVVQRRAVAGRGDRRVQQPVRAGLVREGRGADVVLRAARRDDAPFRRRGGARDLSGRRHAPARGSLSPRRNRESSGIPPRGRRSAQLRRAARRQLARGDRADRRSVARRQPDPVGEHRRRHPRDGDRRVARSPAGPRPQVVRGLRWRAVDRGRERVVARRDRDERVPAVHRHLPPRGPVELRRRPAGRHAGRTAPDRPRRQPGRGVRDRGRARSPPRQLGRAGVSSAPVAGDAVLNGLEAARHPRDHGPFVADEHATPERQHPDGERRSRRDDEVVRERLVADDVAYGARRDELIARLRGIRVQPAGAAHQERPREDQRGLLERARRQRHVALAVAVRVDLTAVVALSRPNRRAEGLFDRRHARRGRAERFNGERGAVDPPGMNAAIIDPLQDVRRVGQRRHRDQLASVEGPRAGGEGVGGVPHRIGETGGRDVGVHAQRGVIGGQIFGPIGERAVCGDRRAEPQSRAGLVAAREPPGTDRAVHAREDLGGQRVRQAPDLGDQPIRGLSCGGIP